MGESHGAYVIGHDDAVLPFVSSINVACGFHAGDPTAMRTTVINAAAHGVAIGAHPGLPDLVGFGRREMNVSASAVYDMVVYQIGALQGVAHANGATLQHVKPHGALYNMAAVRPELADAIARAVRDVDATLHLVGLSGSASIDAGNALGLRTVSEVFADRNYQGNGTLVPRTSADAMVSDVGIAVARSLRMVQTHCVTATDGTEVCVQADTLCIHGDAPDAALFASALRAAFDHAGIPVIAPGSPFHT
jgi:UPF0271 protein